MGHLELFHIAVFASVLLCWVILGAAVIFRKRPPATKLARRGKSFLPGLILQAAGFAAAWSIRRQLFTHMIELPRPLEIALAVLTVLLALLSAAFAVWAVRALGRHWSAEARTIEGHALVTAGPYGVVRHPIYAGLFGMLLATALSISQWEGLAAAVVLYGAGTYFRIAGEEELLSETFGGAYREYASRVPAFFPFLR
jgi:protein-S-isoprenylcysteine O-methyltransferase Ste14